MAIPARRSKRPYAIFTRVSRKEHDELTRRLRQRLATDPRLTLSDLVREALFPPEVTHASE